MTKAGDWRAQAWLLLRLERKRFGARVDVEQGRRVVEQEKLELIEVVRLGILPHLPPRADRAAVAESIRSVSEARRQERRRLRGRRHRTV